MGAAHAEVAPILVGTALPQKPFDILLNLRADVPEAAKNYTRLI